MSINPVIPYENGFNATGITKIISMGEENNSLMNMSVLNLLAGEKYKINTGFETAVLLMQGSVLFRYGLEEHKAARNNFFNEPPIALHAPMQEQIDICAQSPSELIIIQAENNKNFKSVLFDKSNILEQEARGAGLLDNTACRLVRTIFDKRNAPDANLVLGEVVTPPGRWSSYPPHHHEQPEIYHYRFSEPQGYGHAELGEQVFKIKNYDTLKIFNQEEHAQVAAPGYAMMYVWAIRHLPNKPYTMPTFNLLHDWTRHESANSKVWRAL